MQVVETKGPCFFASKYIFQSAAGGATQKGT